MTTAPSTLSSSQGINLSNPLTHHFQKVIYRMYIEVASQFHNPHCEVIHLMRFLYASADKETLAPLRFLFELTGKISGELLRLSWELTQARSNALLSTACIWNPYADGRSFKWFSHFARSAEDDQFSVTLPLIRIHLGIISDNGIYISSLLTLLICFYKRKSLTTSKQTYTKCARKIQGNI